MTVTAELQANPATCLWVCDICQDIYDPGVGDPDGGIPAGTPFEEVPENWVCPVCGARKKEFRPLRVGEPLPEPQP